ncbi:MAG: hypothetical protein WC685_07060 [Methylobacter sp.]
MTGEYFGNGTQCVLLLCRQSPKEKATRTPLNSLGTSLCLALQVLRMQIGYPADLSRRKLRYSARHTGLFSPHRQIHYAINRTWLFVDIADYLTKFLRQAVWNAIDASYRHKQG